MGFAVAASTIAFSPCLRCSPDSRMLHYRGASVAEEGTLKLQLGKTTVTLIIEHSLLIETKISCWR